MKYEGARCLLPQFMGSQTNGADLWMRASRNLGLIGLYLVSQFEASFGSWFGTPCFGVQHQFFYLSFFFFCVEAKFPLHELGRMRQYPGRTWMWMWKDLMRKHWSRTIYWSGICCWCLPSWHDRGLQKLSGESIIFLFSQVDGGDEGHKWVY